MALTLVLLLIFCLYPTTERTHNDARERAIFIRKLHETSKANIEKLNEKYMIADSEGRKEVKFELMIFFSYI
jgi:hypothetical protein